VTTMLSLVYIYIVTVLCWRFRMGIARLSSLGRLP